MIYKTKKAIFISLLLSLYFLSFAFAETIVLKSGDKVEAKIIEKTSDYVIVEISGIPLTYFLEDIDSIDGKRMPLAQVKEDAISSGPAGSGLKIKTLPAGAALKDRRNNSIIYYKNGEAKETKITRRVKDLIFLEVSSLGLELGIGINDIDYIETAKPDLLNNRYVNEGRGISISGPQDWVMVTPDGYYREAIKWSKSQLVYFHKYPLGEYRLKGKIDPFISVVLDDFHPFVSTAWDYAQAQAERFKGSMPGVSVIEGPIEVDFGGRNWVKLIIEVQYNARVSARQLHYFLLWGKSIFWISFGDKPEDFDKNLPAFERSLDSLELR
jgi:hypothetical protein